MHPDLPEFLNILYDTINSPDSWEGCLSCAARLFNARGAQVIHQDMRDFRTSFNRVQGFDWTQTQYDLYAPYIPEDPRLPLFVGNPGRAAHCRMAVDDATYHATGVYKNVLCEAGVEYILGANFGPAEALSGFFLIRDQTQQVFTGKDVELMQLLVPHIQCVLELHSSLSQTERQIQLHQDTMDALGVGIITLNERCQPGFINARARELLSACKGLSVQEGILRAGADGELRLENALRRVLSEDVGAGGVEAFEIQSENGDNLLAFLSLPDMRRNRFELEPQKGKQAVLVLRDHTQNLSDHRDLLCGVYGLTPSQAHLACLISEGLSLREAAVNMAISEGSARQYLKLIFPKMNVNRQSEMVRLVIGALSYTNARKG